MTEHDFDTSIIRQTDHRPWAMPDAPWIMTQTWHDLLFAHWPVDPGSIRAKLPQAFELDLFDGRAWVGVVPFRMTNVAPRGVPSMPWVSAFPEAECPNVRAGRWPVRGLLLQSGRRKSNRRAYGTRAAEPAVLVGPHERVGQRRRG